MPITPEQAQIELRRRSTVAELQRRETASAFPVRDPDKPIGFIEDTIPPVDIPEIADPQDVTPSAIAPTQTAFKKSKVVRPRWQEARDAAARGLASMGSAGKQLIASFWGTPSTYLGFPIPKKSAQAIAETRRANKARDESAFLWEVSKNPALAAQNKDLASKALNLMGETLPYITATTGAFIAAGPVGAFAVGSLVEGNSAYRTALDANVPDKKAQMIGTGVGVISGAVEAFGGRYAEQLLLSATKKFQSKIAKAGAIFGIGTIVEALEEGAQEVAQITGEEIYRDVDWNERTSRILSSMAGGAFLGGVMRGGSVAARRVIDTVEKTVIAKQPTAKVTPQKRTQAIDFVKNVLNQEQYATLDEKAKIEIGQKMLAEQGVEVTAEELVEAAPTEAIEAPEAPLEPITKPEVVGVAPEVPPAGLTPAEAAEEPAPPIPPPPGDAKDAANLLDQYWSVKDEAELEVLRDTMLNQRALAESLGKKRYDPRANKETSDASQAMMLYIDLQEHPEGHNFVDELSDEQRRIYELSQNLPENVRQVADSIAEQNRQAGTMLKDADVIRNARENYIAHIWDVTTEKKPLFARFSQKTARRLHRTLEGGILEGWAKGMNLRVADVTESSRVARIQGIQALAGKKLLDTGKSWRIMGHTQPSGWEKVEHPNFSYWHNAGQVEVDPGEELKVGSKVRPSDRNNLGTITAIEEDTAEVHFVNKEEGTEATKVFPLNELAVVRSYGKNFFITDKGVLMEKTPVYAEPALAKKLNKIFSTSGLYKLPGVKTITKYNAQIKTTILFSSLFHHQAYIRSQMFGSRILNTRKAYDFGRQAIENLDPELRLLVRNGMTIGRIQDYDPSFIHGDQTIWGRVLSKTNLTAAANKALINLRNRQEAFLFGKLGPYLKTGSALVELRAEMKKNKAKLESGEITIDEVAKAVATLMNNDFGGLHLGRLERGATAQHLFRLLTLAPDWTESNVRSMVQMLNRGEVGQIHRLFWTRIAAKGLGATIALNLLLAGFDDDDFWTRLQKAWKANRLRWLDVDITPIYRSLGGKDDKRKYFSLIGHFRDPIKFVVHPFVSAKHKSSVFGRVMLDMATGQDWAGREFTTIGELLGVTEDAELQGRFVKWGRGRAQPIEPGQVPSYLLYETRSSMPIPVQNAISFLSGELDAFDAVTKSLGLMTHTTFPPKKKKTTKKPIFKRRGTSARGRKTIFKKRTR